MTADERDALYRAVKSAVEDAMPLAIGEVLGPQIHAAVRRDTRRWRGYVMVGYLVMVLGLGYAIHDNRVRSTRARGVVCQIIVSGDQSLYEYERERAITHRQLVRALRQSASYRKLLGPAPHCSPGLTPEPVRRPPPKVP